jgi:adenine-specific DNA-methyltransferase
MEKLKMHSTDFTQENIAKLAELFPNCVTESKNEDGTVKRAIDFDQLRQELATAIVDGPQERYQLNWPGKREALLTANAPIAKTLRPCREESVDFETTQNLFIEGDNLDALKLLQETYLNKVKLIYIDPPYNTGNDFIYEDDFAEDAGAYLERSNQKDETGNRLVANTEANGRFHSDWLSMMYSRLKLARNLLMDDGAIFISIDDNEIHNLRKMCDEVFGEDNFACIFVVKSNPRGSQSTVYCASVHENVLCYVKDGLSHSGFTLPLSDEMVSEYKLTDENGSYRLLGLRLRGGSWRREQRPLLHFPIYVNPQNGAVSLKKDSFFNIEILPVQPSTNEDGTWRWSRQKLEVDIDQIIAKEVTRDGELAWDIFQKDYLTSIDGEQRETKPKTIWDEKDVNYQNGTTEVKELFEKNVFDFPKPTYLLTKIIQMATKDNDVILDFFAGSSTTAHAVLQINAEEESERSFIMVQLPQECDEKSDAGKAGYQTIADVSKERIRRAGKKIQKDNAGKDGIAQLDIGFRVLKIDSSNMKDVYYSPDAVKQSDLLGLVNNIREDRTPEDLLFQVLLDWGVDLALPINQESIAGKQVFFVDGNALSACFETGINEEFVKALAARHPMRAVFRDAGFGSDSVKINIEQIFKLVSPTTEVKSI